MTAPNEATRRQIAAAEPLASTWLGANAGSGKTRVLTDRVARLLLDQVPPQNILCLTYTKAAASEMQNRLFAQLGEWAMLDDDALRAALTDKGVGGSLNSERLNAARRLFARAIETPGGLKIQTIHAFCAALLRQFPLEAGVPPGFTELDERSAEALIGEVLDDIASGPQAQAIDGVAPYLTDDSLLKLAQEVLGQRNNFAEPLGPDGALALWGLPPGFDTDALLAEVFGGGEADLLTGLLAVLQRGGANDIKAADKLRPVAHAPDTMDGLAVLEDILLTGKGAKAPFSAKVGSFPNKSTRQKLDDAHIAELDALMMRVEAARSQRLALNAAQRTTALHRLAGAFLPAMAVRKTAQGWLDFDDLILRARDLLRDPAVADWVLYKLDGRIDHILVDEAQDTSPVQWDVIALLARELTSGAGARDDIARTIFVVGDKKQSIYSFQGADPEAFDRMRQDFATSLAGQGDGLRDQVLEHSFRSSAAILSAVDATFAGDRAVGVGGAPHHAAFFDTLPGRVDLWPLVQKPDATPDTDWFEPVDKLSPRHQDAVLADAIAGELRRLIDAGTPIPCGAGQRKMLGEGDVLILVQRRGTLFQEILRACKHHRLEVAGADRLTITRELPVRDLLAVLSFLALPEDDLSLAAALRSPLLGWSEDELYRLAQPRKGHLWTALRTESAETPAHLMLKDLRNHADFLRPYDLIERILTRHRGRENLIARLGPDCEEAVDALLAQALIYEQADVPSLTGFLEWMRADEVEIKRQAESAGGRLRVMTVHGAKGLEAPLVILPDCGKRKPPSARQVYPGPDGRPAWSTSAADATPEQQDAQAAWRERQEAERQRLLYVAMTRAEVWLWVCATENGNSAKAESWHEQVEAGLRALDAPSTDFPTGPGLRLTHGDWESGPLRETRAAATDIVDALPPWTREAPPPPPDRPGSRSPSDLGGAKALPGEAGLDEDAAKARGVHLHSLLETLPAHPPVAWQGIAERLLGPDMSGEDKTALIDEAIGVLTAPALKAIFGPNSLAEVPVTANLPDGSRMSGIIDLLHVAPDRVLAVDFKSNAVVPTMPGVVPEGLLRQMGAYAHALKQIYPDRRVETALLWTRTAQLMPLPADLLDQALASAFPPPVNHDFERD